MEIELEEIRDFLLAHPPFDQLSAEALNTLMGEISVRYLRRSSEVPPKDKPGDFLYMVRKGALAVQDAQGKLMEKLGEGDYFIPFCEDSPAEPLQAQAEEDTLVYLAPCSVLKRLRNSSAEFDQFFSAGTNERLRRAIHQITDEASPSGSSLMNISVGDLSEPRLVQASRDKTVKEAAQIMTDNGVSSLLITEGKQLVGIVTDKDLRRRFICQGLSYDTPIEQVMTPNPISISADTLGFEALLKMTQQGVHHLPVVDSDGLRGLISTTDLIRHQSAHGPYLVREILRAESIADLQNSASRLPRLQVQMASSGATAHHIGQVISSVTDAITQRLLALAEQELGAPPVAYAWVSGGSQARQEQTSYSDQDNALILDDALQPEHAAYFEALARFVCDGLNACGYYYCPGEAMASNPKWRQPLARWQRYFHDWIEKPEPMALMLSSIFFDLRLVAGEASLFHRLQQSVLEKTQQNKIFLAYMAANALQHRPPLGFFRAFVLISDGEHDNTFDIKHRGLVTIVDLARVYALSCGCTEVNTLDRLKYSAAHGALSQEGAANLIDALEFISILRIRHQANQLKQGLTADNYLPPSDLSPLERGHLRDAFKVIAEMQAALDSRYQSSRFY
ncbi:MAG: cyclic nucleotide-binding/CBS domain-containing protein [Gammaproteobacteria bacterium]|nr:cyclic nucleotide-binding/CBS domain-containing protein [Gammaproteobacteria bacterium]